MDCGKLIVGANDRVNEEYITIVLSKHDLAAGGATECSVCRVGGATEGDTVVDEFVEGDGARIGVLDHEVRQETAERDSGTPIGVDATKITMVRKKGNDGEEAGAGGEEDGAGGARREKDGDEAKADGGRRGTMERRLGWAERRMERAGQEERQTDMRLGQTEQEGERWRGGYGGWGKMRAMAVTRAW
ncbi:hypothetical protein BHE74_00026208 [Ensete ventricosum]|nr:hypothetical protein BHE74_00026208 [Ensete ventricosum]